MRKMNFFKKAFILFCCLLFAQLCSGQMFEYAYKLNYHSWWDWTDSPVCHEEEIKDVYYGKDNNNYNMNADGQRDNYISNIVYQWQTFVVPESQTRAVHWYDENNSSWHRYSFNYDIIEGINATHSYDHHDNGTFCDNNTYIDVMVEVCDPVRITNVYCYNSETGAESGSIQCARNNASLIFNLSVQNTARATSIEIQSLSISNGDTLIIKRVNVGSFATQKTVSLSSLIPSNYYGKSVRFRTRTYVGAYIKGPIFQSRTFIPPFPDPTISITKPKCKGDNNGQIYLSFSTIDAANYVVTVSRIVLMQGGACDVTPSSNGEQSEISGYCLTGETENTIVTSNSITLQNLSAGAYEFKAENNVGHSCIFTKLIKIDEPDQLKLEGASPKNYYTWHDTTYNIQAWGATDSIAITISGGNPPYTYFVDGEAVSINNYENIYNYPYAAADTFIVSIADHHNCDVDPDNRTVVMKQPDSLWVRLVSTYTVSCHRENEGTHDDGTVQLSVTGGIGPFSVTADTVVTETYNPFTGLFNDIQLSGFMARNYLLTVHDRFNSTYNIPASFTSRPRLWLDPILEDDMTWPYCIGGANGTLIASGYGGSPLSGFLGKYKYFAEGYIDTVTADTALLENLRSGLHNILIEDKYGCRDRNDSVIIPENPNPLKLFLVDTIRPTCNEYLDGTASFTGRDGSPYKTFPAGYDFTLINLKTFEGQSLRNDTVLFEGLGSANYEISIQDTAQCEANNQYRDTVFLSEPAPIRIRTRVHQVSRKGIPNGSITAVLTGANKNYIYEWYKHLTAVEDSFLLSGTTRDTAYIDGLPAGDYLLRVRDTVGCSNGHGADGWFEWSCTIKEPVYSLGFRLSEQRNVSCHGLSDGSIVIEGVGGWGDNYLYGLQPDQLTPDRVISNLPAGLYTVYVADEEDEMYYDTIRISEPEILTMVANEITPVDCYGNYSGRVAVDITGGTSPYYLSVDSSTNTTQETGITGLPAGIYGITVTDTNGCQAHIEAVIEQPDSIHIELIGQINTLCNEAIGSIETTVSGGTPAYNYTWMNSADTLDNNSSAIGSLEADIYKLIVTDQNACEKESPWYTILNSDGPVIADTVITPVSCYNYSDGRVEILANSLIVPYTYSWSNGQSTNLATGLPSGTCFVTITDEKQCNLYAAIYVPSPDSLSLVALSVIDPQCAGYTNGSIQIDATGGTPEYQFTWNTGDTGNTVVGLRSGNYYVTITDAHQCTNTGQLVLNNPEPVYIDLGGETTICTGQTVTLDAGEFELYSWRFGDSLLGNNRTAELMEAGDYYLEVLNEEGCIGKDTFTVYTANDLLNADFLIKSEAYTDDTVVAINISWPLPDSVSWIYDKNLILGISEQDYEYLIFDKPGTYLITLYAALGGCKDNYTHEIAIVERGNEDELKFGVAGDLIKEFIVHPNPTDGLFTVEVKLSRIHDIALRLFDYSNLIDQKVVRNMKDYEIGYDLHPMKPGVYVLQLIAGKEQKTLKIIYY